MTPEQAEEYLARIGAAHPAAPTEEALHEVATAHLRSVPFENLGIYLDEPCSLEEKFLFAKLVQRRRGGICFEQNGLAAKLLRQLGYTVRHLAAHGMSKEGFSPAFDHLALAVGTGPRPEEQWLVDVGVGGLLQHPLRLSRKRERLDGDDGFEFRVSRDGDLDLIHHDTPQYRIETRSRRLVDFFPAFWWHWTWPRSRFRNGPLCSVATPTGRRTLAGDRLTVSHDGDRHQATLRSDAELLRTYRDDFGIVLDRPPRTEPGPRSGTAEERPSPSGESS
jgi:N-hydroxyarylamine O-acetyltransferase